MSEHHVKIDHDAIMRDAHALRAATLAQIVRSLGQLFGRKPVAAKA